MNITNTQASISPSNLSYSYIYHELRDKLIKGLISYEFYHVIGEETRENDKNEYVSYQEVSKYIKEELLPFIDSIFNYNLFDSYVNTQPVNSLQIVDSIQQGFISLIYNEANEIASSILMFQKGNERFYKEYFGLEEILLTKIFRFIFHNMRFTNVEGNFVFNANSNQFIKEYLNLVLIKVREKPNSTNSGLLEVEINRVQTLILKNANFNFLNWYLSELKSVLTDLKYIHKNQHNYGLSCSVQKLKKLYLELKKYDFIQLEYTTQTDFIDVFLEDWYSHDSICVLKMDNPQTKCFINNFKIHVDSKLSMAAVEKAHNISNNSGYIKSSSLSSSSSRNKLIGPKREHDIMTAFKEIRG
ncbi:hypothetical protein PXC01_05580 [Maribacter sp. M208]|uniref:hypothetical protein n=1 Tax=Maribacter huludaoensis TaxID=3030010 RepID=UPI0023EB215B|nr:hypothetical protein [Maribacter huludaoensis]MDF4221049.1 hypothetical protein [Maribacter huludaoensis]